MSKRRRRGSKATHSPSDPLGRKAAERSLDRLIDTAGGSLLDGITGNDPLHAETTAAALLGPVGIAGSSAAWTALLERCEVVATPRSHAITLLTAALAADPPLRSRAAEIAARLSDRLGRPAWSAALGKASFVGGWQLIDVFGDQAMVMVEFSRGPLLSALPHHGLMFLLDHNGPGSFVKDVTVLDDVARSRSELVASAGQDGLARVEELSAAAVRSLVEPALAASLSAGPHEFYDEPADDVRALHLLAVARLRVLPEVPSPAPEPLDDRAIEELITSFAASPEAGSTKASPAEVRRWAEVIVRFGNERDAGRPLRVGPGKTLSLLFEHDVEDEDAESWGSVLAAWNAWAADRTGLPEAAVLALHEATDELLEDVLGIYPANVVPLRNPPGPGQRATAGSDEAERREFAMPHREAVVNGERYTDLDPGDPDDLYLLVVGEHPEYHHLLDSDELIDGVNPRLHLAMLQVVITRLWQDEPKSTWRQAKKLLATGMDRAEVLNELIGPVAEEVHAALSPELGLLGAQPRQVRPGGADRGDTGSGDDLAFQVRVDITDAKPPIWRRLVLPGSMRLSELHLALQLAFDWTDSHLHDFDDGSWRYGNPHQVDDVRDESAVRVMDLLADEGDRLDYEYDFGDSWRHRIVVEKVVSDASGLVRCLGGRRAAPPEDCGGIYRYNALADAWSDRRHAMHEEAREELEHDPAAFHTSSIDDRLGRVPVS